MGELNPRCKDILNSVTSSLGRLNNIFNLYCYVGFYSTFISAVSKLILSNIDPASETSASDSFTLHPGEESGYFEVSYLRRYAFGAMWQSEEHSSRMSTPRRAGCSTASPDTRTPLALLSSREESRLKEGHGTFHQALLSCIFQCI